jgi:hypothetical protein
MARPRKKPTNPPPPEPDHVFRQPIKIDYRGCDRQRELDESLKRRAEYLANFRKNYGTPC